MNPNATPLFWTENYWSQNLKDSIENTRLTDESGAVIYFAQESNNFSVPGSATFGGWWPQGRDYSQHDYENLLSSILTKYPHATWSFHLPPGYFYPEIFHRQEKALIQLGGTLIHETNSTIQLSMLQSGSDLSNFSRGNRKRLRAFLDRGGEIRKAQGFELRAAHSLLVENRARRGVKLSVDEEKFVGLLKNLPESYKCWLALVGQEILGVAYTVEVSPHSTYVLFWGDSPAGRSVSVVASLCARLQMIALAEGKEFLDLGISSEDGNVDEGLLNFKRNLGASAFRQARISIQSN